MLKSRGAAAAAGVNPPVCGPPGDSAGAGAGGTMGMGMSVGGQSGAMSMREVILLFQQKEEIEEQLREAEQQQHKLEEGWLAASSSFSFSHLFTPLLFYHPYHPFPTPTPLPSKFLREIYEKKFKPVEFEVTLFPITGSGSFLFSPHHQNF